jgi:hypothetical protein
VPVVRVEELGAPDVGLLIAGRAWLLVFGDILHHLRARREVYLRSIAAARSGGRTSESESGAAMRRLCV